MKRLIILFTAFMLFSGLVNAIRPIRVKYTCDVTKINAQVGDDGRDWTLNEPACGWCYVPNIGHNGIIIYKNPYTRDYNVYDLKCPVCDINHVNSTLCMDLTVTLTCPTCETSYNICGVGHPVNSNISEAWLESYAFTMKGNIMYIDNSPGFNQRYRLWQASQHSPINPTVR